MVDIISKSSKKNYNSPFYNTDNNVYNNTVSNFYLNNKNKNKENEIYLNNKDFAKKLNDKIITMKLNKINDENKELTFHPKINKNYKKNPNHSENKNNIQLQKNNSKENSQNAIFNKLYNDGKKKKDFIEKILNEEKNDFIPKINKNYKVTTTFSQRTNKSIMNKNKNFIKQNSLNTKINENKKKLENLKKNELYKIKNNNEKDNKKNTNNFASNLQNNKNDEKYNENNNNNNINEKQIFEINEKNPNINSKIIENKINNIEPKEENNLNFVKSNETNKNNNYNVIKNNNFTDIQSLSDVNSNLNSVNFLNNSMVSNAKKEEPDENKLYSKENAYESKTLKELLKINKDNLK